MVPNSLGIKRKFLYHQVIAQHQGGHRHQDYNIIRVYPFCVNINYSCNYLTDLKIETENILPPIYYDIGGKLTFKRRKDATVLSETKHN